MNPRIRLAHRIAVDGVTRCVDADKAIEMMSQHAAEQIGQAIKHRIPIVICADNVSDMYHSAGKGEWSERSFPNAMPPFECCFVEWKMPSMDGLAIGTLWSTLDPARDKHVAESYVVPLLRNMSSGLSKSEYAESRVAAMISDISNHNYFRLCVAVSCKWNPGDRMAVAFPALFVATLDENGNATHKTCGGPEYIGEINSIHHVPRLTFSMMSCKNVSSVDTPPEMLPEAKWQRRQGDKVKGLVFKTLRIDGMGSATRSATGEPSGEHNRFHICRGSFAEYTAEKPLFGKYTGRFWRPAHVKGSKEVGEVVKEYDVGPRSEVPQEVTN